MGGRMAGRLEGYASMRGMVAAHSEYELDEAFFIDRFPDVG